MPSYPKASDIALEIVDRLRKVLGRQGSYVRLCARPNPEDASYRAEEGVSVTVGPPSPEPQGGAGRHGLKNSRIMAVTVNSVCLLDAAGQDEKAAIAHLDLEEDVVNALVDRHPDNLLSQAGILLNWIPGRSESLRMVRRDTGMLESSITFQLTYPARLST